MDFDDLNKLTHVAHTQNLQISAGQLNVSAGALSKTIKKIEQQLNTPLFDRVGRNILLNEQGKKFIQYARGLLHEYQQMTSEFTGSQSRQTVNLAGPSILVNHWLAAVISQSPGDHFDYNLNVMFEGKAISQLHQGHAHVAIVTGEAMGEANARGLASQSLGAAAFKVAAAPHHPVFTHAPDGSLDIDELPRFPFVCPTSSPFCGQVRGIGSDGWPDDKLPRRIAYRASEFSTMLAIVRQGLALAYVPDYLIAGEGLKSVEIIGATHNYREEIALVYKPSLAHGWLNRLIDAVRDCQADKDLTPKKSSQ